MIFILGVFLTIGGPLCCVTGQSIYIQTPFDLMHFRKSFKIDRPNIHIPFLSPKIFGRFGNDDSFRNDLHLRGNFQKNVYLGDQNFDKSESYVNSKINAISVETATTTTSKNIADKAVTGVNSFLSTDRTESTTYSDETTDFTTEIQDTTQVPDYDVFNRISSQVVASLLG